MTEQHLLTVLEGALHAAICTRCKQSYRHELTNGLQGVYGGIDALIRAAQTTRPGAVPVERVVEFVRQAMVKHEQSLDGVLGRVIPDDCDAAVIDVDELLAEIVRFLVSDAARTGVRLSLSRAGPTRVSASPSRLRLAFLGLLTDAIDSLPAGGDIAVAIRLRGARVEIELSDTRAQSGSPTEDLWAVDLARKPLYQGIVMHVARRIITEEGGSIDCTETQGMGRALRVMFNSGP